MEYLKDKSYYEELYDKATIDKCRCTEQSSIESLKKDIKDGVKVPKGYALENVHYGVFEFMSYFQVGDRYLEKDETIRQWMAKDERKDQLRKRPEPLVYCPKCSRKMVLILKDAREDLESDDIRVIYFYKCEDCQEKRGVYDNGEPYVFEGDLCPECKASLKKVTKRSAKKITINSICEKCGHRQNYSYDLDEKPLLVKEENDSYFEKDKARFCLSKEEGEEYRSSKSNLMWLIDSYKEEDEHKEAYEKAKRTKILTIAQLSDVLSKEFIKHNFGSLMISSPEMGRDLIVKFTTQDMKVDRSEFNSRKDLKKILGERLGDTNWQMMSQGLDYKLGMLSGRLRGQDSQEHIYDDLKNG